MDDYPVSSAEEEQLAIQFIRNYQSLGKLFKNSERSIDMNQYFMARELLTGKAGSHPEDHGYYSYLETLKTIGAQAIKESV
ncbi:uncharacterized protein N7515_005001 [Penicillium bovifimosum]|uniref:Uncharacterized protein n=1 Tax=Penicillium bovifimosum TaxID=126998 RepID=A0A9W9L3W2_9EURO|nr:uncharacterized protein N7515_005001 [Penicillium bovifimosum]KAJ5135723.1 hypothetical protein N7515_005001 [Penicillium bovifimosum]